MTTTSQTEVRLEQRRRLHSTARRSPCREQCSAMRPAPACDSGRRRAKAIILWRALLAPRLHASRWFSPQRLSASRHKGPPKRRRCLRLPTRTSRPSPSPPRLAEQARRAEFLRARAILSPRPARHNLGIPTITIGTQPQPCLGPLRETARRQGTLSATGGTHGGPPCLSCLVTRPSRPKCSSHGVGATARPISTDRRLHAARSLSPRSLASRRTSSKVTRRTRLTRGTTRTYRAAIRAALRTTSRCVPIRIPPEHSEQGSMEGAPWRSSLLSPSTRVREHLVAQRTCLRRDRHRPVWLRSHPTLPGPYPRDLGPHRWARATECSRPLRRSPCRTSSR